MAKKKSDDINYELLLLESSLGDYKLQQKLVRDLRGYQLLSEDGKNIMEVMKKAQNEYEPLTLDNYISYATTMSNNAKENSKYINSFANLGISICGADDFEKYLDIVKKKIKEEKLKVILQKVNIDVSNGNVDEAIRKLNLENIRENMNVGKEKTREEKMVDFMLDIDNNYSGDAENGVMTGVKVLDDAFGKIKRGELFVIGGSSGSSKSLICNNMFSKWIMEGKNVIYLSLEMGLTA